MRLINLYTYQFREFYRWDIPPYAILSHCWGDPEIPYSTFSPRWARLVDLCHRIGRLIGGKRVTGDVGYDKIVAFCQAARTKAARGWDERKLEHREVRLEWAWIDTCCIDIRSSAELSEGIQSMFPFYEFSTVCYAYLGDVPAGCDAGSDEHQNSRWYKRGWTLQELLAPWDVIFYDQQWNVIGHKCTHRKDEAGHCTLPRQFQPRFGPAVNHQISKASGIATEYLETPRAMLRASVACRMSWAAHRETKRVEDVAYSLLGIFDVNMPKLYGEGRNAFVRLQDEIMQMSNDTSIFAWEHSYGGTGESMLATSPAAFAGCRNVRRLMEPRRTMFNIIKRHIDYRGPAMQWDDQTFVLRLNCCFKDGRPVELAVSRSFAVTEDLFQYSRVCCDAESEGEETSEVERRYPRSGRREEKIETLNLTAFGSLLGAREIRHLCHDLEAVSFSPHSMDLPQAKQIRILHELDQEEVRDSAAWKYIGPVYDAVAAGPRLVDLGSEESNDDYESKDSILMKARKLAIGAVWQERRMGSNS